MQQRVEFSPSLLSPSIDNGLVRMFMISIGYGFIYELLPAVRHDDQYQQQRQIQQQMLNNVRTKASIRDKSLPVTVADVRLAF